MKKLQKLVCRNSFSYFEKEILSHNNQLYNSEHGTCFNATVPHHPLINTLIQNYLTEFSAGFWFRGLILNILLNKLMKPLGSFISGMNYSDLSS